MQFHIPLQNARRIGSCGKTQRRDFRDEIPVIWLSGRRLLLCYYFSGLLQVRFGVGVLKHHSWGKNEGSQSESTGVKKQFVCDGCVRECVVREKEGRVMPGSCSCCGLRLVLHLHGLCNLSLKDYSWILAGRGNLCTGD